MVPRTVFGVFLGVVGLDLDLAGVDGADLALEPPASNLATRCGHVSRTSDMRTLLLCARPFRNARSSPRSWKFGGRTAVPPFGADSPAAGSPVAALCHAAQCAGSAELTSSRYLHGGALLFPDTFAIRSTTNSTPRRRSSSHRRPGSIVEGSSTLRSALRAAFMSHSTSTGSSFSRVRRGSHWQYVSMIS